MEHLDHQLTGLADGAAFPIVLLVALLLGLRHATDPDHLAAVAPLATEDPADRRRAIGLGAAWGSGHAATMLVIGIPLLWFRAEVPETLGTWLERAVGVMIVLVATVALLRWVRSMRSSRAVERGPVRTARTAFVVGVVHGLAGTGAVVLLVLSLLPSRGEALAALLVFAPASIASMALVTGGWTWLLARPRLADLHRVVLVPLISVVALLFGLSYAGAF
ncbi:MAG: hypothetical protein WC558_01630 [Patulibacter sp.]